MIRGRSYRQGREPTIALINIVFLMLVFFMVAGSLNRLPQSGLSLVRTEGLQRQVPPDVLIVHRDGSLSHGGLETDAARFVANLAESELATLRLLPDRDLPARTLVGLSNHLRALGAGRILIVTEQGLP